MIVEDEPILAAAVQAGLRRHGMTVDAVTDGGTALEYLASTPYDAVVLDRDLPGVHGDDVCQVIIERYPACRVLMLTAARRLRDKVEGLELGADDYLVKPFEFPELVARLRALHRRGGPVRPPVLQVGAVRLDPFRREVYRRGRLVQLTRKEFAVLEVLMRDPGATISAEQLLDKAWDVNSDPFTNAVRITMSTLRAKLGEPWTIETVTGVGYRLSTADGG